jgi:hypothetical protein
MNRALGFLLAASLAGCVAEGPAEGPGPAYVGAVSFDGYYDDAYGPFYDGYWGPGGYFYYSDARGHPFRRDEAGHFRHEAGPGFHPVHGLGHMGAPAPRAGGAR